MRIALDMDDVVLDLCGGLANALRTEFGYNPSEVPIEAFQDKDWVLPDGKLLWGPEVFGHYLDDESWLRDRDWVWATFPAIPGALGGIRQLRAAGHYIELVTKKPQWAEWVTWKWLGRWRPEVNAVIIVDLAKGGSKLDHSTADICIDDSVTTCYEFAAERRGAIIFDQEWNQLNQNAPNLLRAFSWEDIPAMVDAFVTDEDLQ